MSERTHGPSIQWQHRPQVRTALSVLLVCAGYYAAGAAALELRFDGGGITAIWPSTAIVLAALLTTQPRYWWAFLAALLPTHLHLIDHFQSEAPLRVALVQYAGNTGQALLAATLVRKFLGVPLRFDDLKRTTGFVLLAALVAPGILSVIVAWLFVQTGWVGAFLPALRARILTNVFAALAVTPLLLEGPSWLRALERSRLREYLVVTAILLALAVPIFTWQRSAYGNTLFVPLPFLLWSAVRFGPAGLCSHLLVVAAAAVGGTQAGVGPFVAESAGESVLALQVFLPATSVPLLLLAALVQERDRSERALRQSQAQYRSVVEDQTELICRFLADGTYTFVNGAYCRYFGRTPEELLGRTFYQFIPEEDRKVPRGMLDSITPDNPVVAGEHEVIGPWGEVRWQQWTNRGLWDANGCLVEYQAVGRDITDRRQAEEERRLLESQRRAEEVLREANRRKDEFLATLAHELRNPLAPIALAVEFLHQRPASSNDSAWALDIITRQLAQMTRLVDDLLDVARTTQGKIRLQIELLDLRSVVTQAVESSSSLMRERGHAFDLSLPPVPVIVQGDAVRLSQIVANLLNNAAKFTEPGGRVELSVVQDGAQAVLTVRDNGIGIEPALLPHVFDLFIQAEGAGVQPGLGIGLTLVRRLVELHGGTIEARSPGKGLGSEFVARLPALNVSAPRVADLAPLPVPSDGPRLRILVVDDNVDAAASLTRLLANMGHNLRMAHDGQAALKEAAAFAPQVVLLDIGMPGMDGLEVARRLRIPQGDGPLLVAVTGFGQEADRRRSAEAGFDRHFTKPIDIPALRSLLSELGAAIEGTATDLH